MFVCVCSSLGLFIVFDKELLVSTSVELLMTDVLKYE